MTRIKRDEDACSSQQPYSIMPKATTSLGRDQKSITSFFGGGDKKPAKSTANKAGKSAKKIDDESSAEEVEDDAESEVSDEDDAPAQYSKTDGKIESSSLPPLYHVPTMFSDLVSHIPQIKDVTERVRGRKLRIATMCSGTESPLLALELICQSIQEQYGIALEFEHVFSCEIEPFKQAYIERNFKPPLLFRDVCELGDTEAYVLLSVSWPDSNIALQYYCIWRISPCPR